MLIFPKRDILGPPVSRAGDVPLRKKLPGRKMSGPGPGPGPLPARGNFLEFSWEFPGKIPSFLTLWMAVADRYQKSARFAWSESFFTHLRPRSLRGIPFARYNIYRAPRNRALPRHASARPDFLYLAISAGRGVYHCLGEQGGPANLRPNPMW